MLSTVPYCGAVRDGVYGKICISALKGTQEKPQQPQCCDSPHKENVTCDAAIKSGVSRTLNTSWCYKICWKKVNIEPFSCNMDDFFVLYYKISTGLGWEQKLNVRAEGLNPHLIVPVTSAHRILELPCSWTHLFPIISNIFKYKALGQNSASKLSSCLSFFCQTSAPLGPGKLAWAVLSFFHPHCTPAFGLGFLSFSFFFLKETGPALWSCCQLQPYSQWMPCNLQNTILSELRAKSSAVVSFFTEATSVLCAEPWAARCSMENYYSLLQKGWFVHCWGKG